MCSWFKFNNLGLTIGMDFKFHTCVIKGVKIKGRFFYELTPKCVEVTEETLVGALFVPFPPILNIVKHEFTRRHLNN